MVGFIRARFTTNNRGSWIGWVHGRVPWIEWHTNFVLLFVKSVSSGPLLDVLLFKPVQSYQRYARKVVLTSIIITHESLFQRFDSMIHAKRAWIGVVGFQSGSVNHEPMGGLWIGWWVHGRSPWIEWHTDFVMFWYKVDEANSVSSLDQKFSFGSSSAV